MYKKNYRTIKLNRIDPFDEDHIQITGDDFFIRGNEESTKEHYAGIKYVTDSILGGRKIIPIVVKEISPEKYKRLDGFKRYFAYKKLGVKEIPCYVDNDAKAGAQEHIPLFKIEVLSPIKIFVLFHNLIDVTQKCIQSIVDTVKEVPYKIIAVDNGSTEKYSFVIRDAEDIQILKTDRNLGCTLGYKYFIDRFDGYIVCLANDHFCKQGWLENLIDLYLSDNRIGILASRNALSDKIELPNRLIETDYAPLGQCLFEKSKYNQTKGIDVNYAPAYWEDVDLSYQFKKLGYKVGYASASMVEHFGSFTYKTQKRDMYGIWQKNKEYFEKKWNKVHS